MIFRTVINSAIAIEVIIDFIFHSITIEIVILCKEN